VSPTVFTIIGLLANLAGVILLFRYGMPYAVRTGGANFIITEQKDQNAISREKWYSLLGWLGLGLIVLGTLFQIIGAQ
jgi:hypothetical protein